MIALNRRRRLAAELGIAVGLVNIYLKRCVKKGLLKMAEAPARRYAYYLTPYGFAEKARLTLEYLSYSFDLFRRAKADCSRYSCSGRARICPGRIGWRIRTCRDRNDLCAETGIQIVVIVDTGSSLKTFAGLAVVGSYDRSKGRPDAVVVTELKTAHETYLAAVERFGVDRVLVPSMLGVADRKDGRGAHMTIDMASAWYVVHTHPRAKPRRLLNLDRQGFSCYLPRYLKRRRHARRVETVAAATVPPLLVCCSRPCETTAGGRSARLSVSRTLSTTGKASAHFCRNHSSHQGARGRAWICQLAAKAAVCVR